MNKWYIKIIIGIMAVLSVSWSAWFWMNHPERFASPSEINKFCIDPINITQTEYCIGYNDGLEWLTEQYRLKEIEENIQPITNDPN